MSICGHGLKVHGQSEERDNKKNANAEKEKMRKRAKRDGYEDEQKSIHLIFFLNEIIFSHAKSQTHFRDP